MASPSNIQGPGMLWVTSRISESSKDILNEETFLKWYDEDHIAELVDTSGIKDAFRYIDIKKDTSISIPKPFLAFYPMQDLSFTQGDEFRKIRVKSDILPGSGIIYDMADMDVRYLGLISKTEPMDGTGLTSAAVVKAKSGPAPYLLTSAIEPAKAVSDSSIRRFYDEQTEFVSSFPGYIRTLRFKLLYARTNAQSRAFKGLPTGPDEPLIEPPTWIAVHEFEEEPGEEVLERVSGEGGEVSEVLWNATQNECVVYRLARVHGSGKFFE